MSNSIDELNARYGIPNILRIEPAKGLPRIVVTAPAASGEVYLHGAHVTAWQPAGHDPVLWMSKSSWFEPGKPIRGGVPLCFPWFGPNTLDPNKPAHGWARLMGWQLAYTQTTSDGGARVILTLNANGYQLKHDITFGPSLKMSLTIQNSTGHIQTIEAAQHTYFTVGDIKTLLVSGLDKVDYIDKIDAAKRKTQSGDITFTGETDRVYLNTAGPTTIHDPALKRDIIITKENASATVVWNPWINKSKAMPDFGDSEWPGMVCVETCNVNENKLTLKNNATHEMTTTVTVKKR